MTFELVTPLWKLTPSAVWSQDAAALMVKLVIGPSIQAPTLVCSIHTLSTVELRHRAADAVDLVAVVALLDVADDREVLERDVAARAAASWPDRYAAVTYLP